jgi:hypothetical protein
MHTVGEEIEHANTLCPTLPDLVLNTHHVCNDNVPMIRRKLLNTITYVKPINDNVPDDQKNDGGDAEYDNHSDG